MVLEKPASDGEQAAAQLLLPRTSGTVQELSFSFSPQGQSLYLALRANLVFKGAGGGERRQPLTSRKQLASENELLHSVKSQAESGKARASAQPVVVKEPGAKPLYAQPSGSYSPRKLLSRRCKRLQRAVFPKKETWRRFNRSGQFA